MQMSGKTTQNGPDTTARVRVQIALDTAVGRKRLKNARRNGSRGKFDGS